MKQENKKMVTNRDDLTIDELKDEDIKRKMKIDINQEHGIIVIGLPVKDNKVLEDTRILIKAEKNSDRVKVMLQMFKYKNGRETILEIKLKEPISIAKANHTAKEVLQGLAEEFKIPLTIKIQDINKVYNEFEREMRALYKKYE